MGSDGKRGALYISLGGEVLFPARELLERGCLERIKVCINWGVSPFVGDSGGAEGKKWWA